MTRFFQWSLKSYRRLLTLYPEDLRREFGAEILEEFENDLLAECAAHGIGGAIHVWRIALRETIRIGLPAWRQNPAVAVPVISTVIFLGTQSPMVVLTIRRAAQLHLQAGDAILLHTWFLLAGGAVLTTLTSFVAAHRWKRSSLISLGLG